MVFPTKSSVKDVERKKGALAQRLSRSSLLLAFEPLPPSQSKLSSPAGPAGPEASFPSTAVSPFTATSDSIEQPASPPPIAGESHSGGLPL